MSEEQTRVTSQPGPIAENRPSPDVRPYGLVRLLKAVNDWIIVILEAPFKYLFGRDIFISYARVDAANYAQQLAIDLRGRNPKFSFYLDQWASLSGTKLPPSLNRALRWSHLLVLIGSEQGLASRNVRLELEVFFKQQGRFVPIDVDGVLHSAMQKDEFLAAICGPGAVMETAKNLASSKPSEAVITRVANAADFTRQDQRLRRAVKRTTLGVLAVLVFAYVVSRQIVADTKSQAAVAVSTANQQVMTAEQQQEQALLKVGKPRLPPVTPKRIKSWQTSWLDKRERKRNKRSSRDREPSGYERKRRPKHASKARSPSPDSVRTRLSLLFANSRTVWPRVCRWLWSR